jgi:hypothetical protein
LETLLGAKLNKSEPLLADKEPEDGYGHFYH